MNEQRVRERLGKAPVPDESGAEERAWRVMSAAFEEQRTRTRPQPRPQWRLGLAMGAVIAVCAVALTPAGPAVADWVKDAFDPGRDDAEPGVVSLPAAGRLLVTSERGPWVVQRDGSKRRLGAYEEAEWSPEGLFVVVTRGRQLVAVEPDGDPRWSLARAARTSRPVWSPDGFRIAYLSGASLRVVAGDGTGDRPLAPRVARGGAAWRPGANHVLAYADRQGRIVGVQTDARRRLWRSTPGPLPTQLTWTLDGRRLLALSPGSVRVLDPRGRLLRALKRPPGGRAEALAVHPSGTSVALADHYPRGRRGEVLSIPLRGGTRPRRLFAGDGRFSNLAWSPNGRWLLIGWPDADQWLFVRAAATPKVIAASGIAREFDPGARARGTFPRFSGWCCPR